MRVSNGMELANDSCLVASVLKATNMHVLPHAWTGTEIRWPSRSIRGSKQHLELELPLTLEK